MARDKLPSIPRAYRKRLKAAGEQIGLGADYRVVAARFIDAGLSRSGAGEGSRAERLTEVLDAKGYASEEELVEHLLVLGLQEVEQPDVDPEVLKKRLRGLGYID
jgi:hypothetical protein